MSSFTELTDLLTNSFGGTIKPQFLQIANLEIVKFINTGDRVKDGAIVIVLNTLLSLLLSMVYYLACEIYNYANNKLMIINGNSKYKIIVKDVLKTIKPEDMANYNFRYGLYDGNNEIGYHILSNYLNTNNIIDDYNSKKQVNVYQAFNFRHYSKIEDFHKQLNSYDLLTPSASNGGSSTAIHEYFIPVEVYKNKYGQNEYIFLYESNLVSKSSFELTNFIKKVMEDFIQKRYVDTSKNLNIYECSYDPVKDQHRMNMYDSGNINKNITFDTIYFDQKPVLLDWINKFSTETMYPKNLSLVNKLGILLYGPPGTGKTGCICALANKLQRHILIIKSLTLRGQGQNALKALIREYQKKSIIVFDEIDYLLNSEERDDDTAYELLKYNELLIKATGAEEKASILKIIETIKNNSSSSLIDIRFILSLLDGLGNDTDRVIIATTNNPDKINPLFLRPGRFDVVMKLGYCSLNMFKDIIRTKYPELDDNFFKINGTEINNILSLNITPLVLINKLVVSSSVDNLFGELSKLSKQNYESKPKNN